MKLFKRILLTIIGLALLTFIILYIVGKTFTLQEEISVTIDAPVEFTFKEFMDADNMSTWMDSEIMAYKSMERISGVENEIGSQWKLTFTNKKGNKDFSMIETVTDFKPNERFAFNLDDELFDFDMDIGFKEEGGKTIITEKQSGKGKMALMNAMLKFSQKKSRKEKIRMYEQLKELVEKKYEG